MSGNTSGWGQPDPGSPTNDETTMFPPVDAGAGQDPAAPGTSSPWQADAGDAGQAPAQGGPQGPAQNPWAAPPQYRHQTDGYGEQQPQQYGQQPQDQQNYQDYQGYQGYQAPYPPQQEPQKSGGVGKVLAIVIPVLVVIALILALVWQWDNLFGSDDDNGSGGAGQSTVQPAPGNGQGSGQGNGQNNGQGGDQPQGQARPTTANLPGGSVPANDAARNGEPTGQFNAVWVSPPNGSSYTSEDFGVAVRDAFVNDYLADPARAVDRTVNATSPTNGQSYTMSCRDQGSYVHCTGGNNANVYIA
jgi:hypothetical protein